MCNKHFNALKQLDFKLGVGPRNINGLVVRFTFAKKIQLITRIQSRWKAKTFVLAHADEKINPEGTSKYQAFEYMTN